MSGLFSCGFLLIHVSCYWPGPPPPSVSWAPSPGLSSECDQASASGSGAAEDTGAVNKTPSSNIQDLLFSVSDGSYGKDILLKVGDLGRKMLYNRWVFWCRIQIYFRNLLFERKYCGPQTEWCCVYFWFVSNVLNIDDAAGNFRIMIKWALELSVEHWNRQ